MRSYEAARGLFSFLAFCAWGVILLGVIVALIGGNAASTGFRSGPNELQVLLAAAPGAIVSLAGFYGLALVQMGRASVDSAEYGQQALQVARQQLEVSREVLAQGKTAAASYAALLRTSPAVASLAAAPANEDDAHGMSYGNRETPPAPANTEPNELPADAETQPATLAAPAEPSQPAVPELTNDVFRQIEIEPEQERVIVPVAKVIDAPEVQKPTQHVEPVLAEVSLGPEQIENAPTLSSDDMLPNGDPVNFKNGMWHVGERTFQSETPARNYAAHISANSAPKISDA